MVEYSDCRECGNEYVGNGQGKMHIDTAKGYFMRSCKCGWKIEIGSLD